MRLRSLLRLASACCLPMAAEVSFNRDIRPIMSDTCFRCHGPDRNTRMAGLRLDLREEALKKTSTGVVPIVPGRPDDSAIVARVFATGAKVMPPAFAHKELTRAQKDTIRQWVAEGARYEGHWAYQPVRRPAVSGNENPIDQLIEARLTREGVKASPEAGARTLVRRVTLDLTGLPPTPAEMAAYLSDKRPGAYERLVDRLLASPRYAERQTQHWLDAVRYADTCGFHGDNPFPAWPYRDYVLRAFRDNKPFDLFTREQLAGDLLPGSTNEQKVASAFNRLNRTSAEGGLQPKEYLAKYAADRVRTVSTVWMGSTMGCAECHDHKFDPFQARDFYSMKAFFADIRETGLVPDRGPKAWGSQLLLPDDSQREKLRKIDEQTAAVKNRVEQKLAALGVFRDRWEAALADDTGRKELDWRFQRPVRAAAERGTKLAVFNDELVDRYTSVGASLVPEKKPGAGLIVASGPNPDNETFEIEIQPGAGRWTAAGIEIHADESLPGSRVARGADRFVITEVEIERKPRGERLPMILAASSVTFNAPGLAEMSVLDGNPATGWGVATYGERDPMLALRFAQPVETTAGEALVVRIRHDSAVRRAVIGRFRIALTSGRHSAPWSGRPGEWTAAGLSAPAAQALAKKPAERTEEQRKVVDEYLAYSHPDFEALTVELAQLDASRSLLEAGIARVVVTEPVEPEPTRLLPRGNFLDESGEVVQPAIPAVFGKLTTAGRATRLDLANWLTAPDNPLTPRVTVNRLWRQFFGTGLTRVLDDFGSQGELPTHAELLDWLAAEFVQPSWNAQAAHGWDVRHIVRTIVLSRAYRRASLPRADLDPRDADNRLYARQNRYRVEAEAVRDIALAVSGVLTEKFGGPSVRPYQPEGYLATLNFPKRDYSASRGEDQYRRGLYTHWQRSFLHPSMAAFDAPTREECVINRSVSNTPLQALVLLNDPTYVEAARVFAQKALQDGKADPIGWAFERATGRAPAAGERTVLTNLRARSLARYRQQPAAAQALANAGEYERPRGLPAAELAAMVTVTRAILNIHETISRD
ncbi:MAG: DUF1553 domain-containing protein [Acidobacteria bacterium]|nr:DUF1553 domain-containing protein [Acidobacteriota bacterium]